MLDMMGIAVGLAGSFIGVFGYLFKKNISRIDILERNSLHRSEAKELITDKLAPIQVHIEEIKHDIRDIKDSLRA